MNGSPVGATPTRSQHVVAPVGFQRQAVQEQLRDRLDGELVVDVSDTELLTLQRHRRDGEPIRVDVGQLGDVRRRLALAQRTEPLVQLDAGAFEPRAASLEFLVVVHGVDGTTFRVSRAPDRRPGPAASQAGISGRASTIDRTPAPSDDARPMIWMASLP